MSLGIAIAISTLLSLACDTFFVYAFYTLYRPNNKENVLEMIKSNRENTSGGHSFIKDQKKALNQWIGYFVLVIGIHAIAIWHLVFGDANTQYLYPLGSHYKWSLIVALALLMHQYSSLLNDAENEYLKRESLLKMKEKYGDLFPYDKFYDSLSRWHRPVFPETTIFKTTLELVKKDFPLITDENEQLKKTFEIMLKLY